PSAVFFPGSTSSIFSVWLSFSSDIYAIGFALSVFHNRTISTICKSNVSFPNRGRCRNRFYTTPIENPASFNAARRNPVIVNRVEIRFASAKIKNHASFGLGDF
ncbi:MAG: hypothetical protein ABR577_14265, partial [Pyrinomonadaceae bacterium]